MTQKPQTSTPGTEIQGKVKNYNVEVVIRKADGTVKEKRIETISKAR